MLPPVPGLVPSHALTDAPNAEGDLISVTAIRGKKRETPTDGGVKISTEWARYHDVANYAN